MNSPNTQRTGATQFGRWALALLVGSCLTGLPMALAACDNTESHSKSTTTKTVETPTEKTKTTTTTEKKVETQKKE